jgi:hypothetical protein
MGISVQGVRNLVKATRQQKGTRIEPIIKATIKGHQGPVSQQQASDSTSKTNKGYTVT